MKPEYIYGMHDPGGEHLFADAKGWIVFTEGIGADPNNRAGRDYSQWSDAGYGVIVRLNHGYGSEGTIPVPSRYPDFATRVANYIAASRGCSRWIIGNEPNHAQERPQGQPITPEMYIDCYRQVYGKVTSAAGVYHALMPAPVAPWNLQSGDWLVYHRTVWQALWQIAGGVPLHAYTHGAAHSLISSEERVQGWHWHFRVYRDFLVTIPTGARGLAAYITEMNQGDDAWVDANTRWVEAAYDEIDQWNAMEGTQKIFCGCLYRWPKLDKWAIEDKSGVHADLRAAVARRFRVPDGRKEEETLFMPQLGSGPEPAVPPAPTPDLPPREWDDRLTQRGVRVDTPTNLQPGQKFWRVVRARWFNEQEAGGRHHIYVEAPDGTPFRVTWPSGNAPGRANGRSGFDAGNVPMSKSLNEFSVHIDDGTASERVAGIGMGANGNSGIHTSTLVTFQLVTMPGKTQTPPAQPVERPAQVPLLSHPIADASMRRISQHFGENPADYARFGLAGHNGVDFAVPIGTPIGAADSGVVQESGAMPDLGDYVKLRHPWGETVYAHLSARKVERGEPVNRGSIIGRSGNSGNSTGPHLHFALRVLPYQRGAPFDGFSDPLPFLSGTSVPQPTPNVLGVIKAAAQEFGVEWQLLASLAWAESSFNPNAVSAAGAVGLFQLMPDTWAEWRAKTGASGEATDAAANARVGAAYYAQLRRMLGNDWSALAAYNFGIGNVLNQIKPPDITVEFINKVLHGRDLLKAVKA